MLTKNLPVAESNKMLPIPPMVASGVPFSPLNVIFYKTVNVLVEISVRNGGASSPFETAAIPS
jgi:hypothetical protein